MHQVQINIARSQTLQTRIDSLLHTLVPRVIELSGKPDILTRHSRVLDSKPDFSFIAIGKGSVDVTVPLTECDLDRLLDFVRLRLPCPETEGGDLVAGVEGEGFPGVM